MHFTLNSILHFTYVRNEANEIVRTAGKIEKYVTVNHFKDCSSSGYPILAGVEFNMPIHPW